MTKWINYNFMDKIEAIKHIDQLNYIRLHVKIRVWTRKRSMKPYDLGMHGIRNEGFLKGDKRI